MTIVKRVFLGFGESIHVSTNVDVADDALSDTSFVKYYFRLLLFYKTLIDKMMYGSLSLLSGSVTLLNTKFELK